MKKTLFIIITFFSILITVKAQTLRAFYPFNGNANDAVGVLNGTVNGATPTTDRFGNADKAFSFDGINDNITYNAPWTNLTNNFSITVWITSNTTFATILTNGLNSFPAASPFNGYSIKCANNAVGDINGVASFVGNTNIPLNTWTFIALIRDNGVSKLYVNGVLQTSTITATPFIPTTSAIIGSLNSAVDFWNGKIDDVKIYNGVVSVAQLLQEYNEFACNIPAPSVSTSGPVNFCAGGNVTLTSNTTTGNLWSNGATTQSITVNSSGNYSLTVTDANGCTATSAITSVIVNPLPARAVITTNGPTSFCQGGSVVLTSSFETGNLWSTGETTQSITVSSSGNYRVRHTDANGCANLQSLPAIVTVNPLPEAPTISASGPLSFCEGSSVTLTSSAVTGNIWSTGETTQGIVVNSAGQFAVTTTNINGCSSAASLPIIVTVNPNTTYFRDADGDGFGNAVMSILACSVPAGYVTNADDCNDNNPTIYPGATEILNNLDDDCDGSIDEGLTCPEGGLIWQKSIGGSQNEQGGTICKTSDGGYIITGRQHNEILIIKINNTGNIQWQKSLGLGIFVSKSCIKETSDGGYIFCGGAYPNNPNATGNHGGYDYWIVKLGNTGNIQWQKSYGGGFDDFAQSIENTSDGGFIIAGHSMSNDGDVNANHGEYDYWIVKINNSGNIEWQKCLGGTSYEYCTSIKQTVEGGYIIAGVSYSNNGDVSGNHGQADYWIVKINNIGNIEWQRALGGTGSEFVGSFNSLDLAVSIQQTSDEGYIIAGSSVSNNGDVSGNHGGNDFWIVKLNNDGIILWQKSLGGTQSDIAKDIKQAADGGYIISGFTSSNDGDVTGNHGSFDYWIVKIDMIGNIEWQKCLGGNGKDLAHSVELSNEGGYIIAGSSESSNGNVTGNNGGSDFWIVKLSGSSTTVFYQDTDGDGYGNAFVSMFACEKPVGYVTDNTDCIDNNNSINPGAIEICGNGIDDNCNGQVDELNNLPAITKIFGPVNVCAYVGTNQEVVYNVLPVPNAINYVWRVPLTANIIAGQGTNTIRITFSAGFIGSFDKQISVYAVSGCDQSNTKILYLATQIPSTPTVIHAGSSNICSAIGTNISIRYSISKIASAESYIWSAQDGTTIITHPHGLGENDTAVLVKFTSSFTTSTISVRAVNSCGSGGVRSLTIYRKTPPQPTIITGPTNICNNILPNGSFATYSVDANPDIDMYRWNVVTIASSGGTFITQMIFEQTSPSNSITLQFPNTTPPINMASITVVADNGCGTSSSRSLTANVLKTTTPGAIDVINTSPCPNRRYSYTIAQMPLQATSIEWTVPTGGTIISGQGTTSISVSYNFTAISGNVTATAVNNCSRSNARSTPVKLPACILLRKEEKEEYTNKSNIIKLTGIDLDISPNPSTSYFKIRAITAGKEEIKIRIMDVQGRPIDHLTILPYQTIKLGASLNPGTYLIEVTQGNQRIIKKLIKL